jgi:hypothetical protein
MRISVRLIVISEYFDQWIKRTIHLFKSLERPEMYGTVNLKLQTAIDETLNVLTVQFDHFKTEVTTNFREVGKRMIGLRKHLDRIENCQNLWKNVL